MRREQDGYNKNWVGSARPAGAAGTMVTVVIYLEDVEADGGGYCYWRGGCHTVHDFFRSQPHVIDGRFVRQEEFQQHGWAPIYGGNEGRTENIAQAGAALVVHGWTPHSASRNMRQSPRMAIIQRWNDKGLSLFPATQEEVEAFEDRLQERLYLAYYAQEPEAATPGGGYTDTAKYVGSQHQVPERLFEHWGPEVRAAAAAAEERTAGPRL